jgi:hypothetical protein
MFGFENSSGHNACLPLAEAFFVLCEAASFRLNRSVVGGAWKARIKFWLHNNEDEKVAKLARLIFKSSKNSVNEYASQEQDGCEPTSS